MASTGLQCTYGEIDTKLSMEIGLLAIDIQKGFHNSVWGPRNNPQAEVQMEEILGFWRLRKWPVFIVQHLSRQQGSPLRSGQLGSELLSFAEPREKEILIQKSVNSAFIGTDLEQHLKAQSIKEILLMGFTSDHCVSTTARMGANLGYKINIAADATTTFDRITYDKKTIPAQLVHEVSLASLHGEFASVFSQENLLNYLKIL